MTKQFTFSNGTTVDIGKIPPLLIQEVRKSFPPPRAPVEMVDMGDGITEAHENTAHPDFIKATEDYNSHIEEIYREMVIKLGVKSKLTDDQMTQVNERREFMSSLGMTLDKNDVFVFVSYIAIESAEDYKNLFMAVTGESQPTEARVSEIGESFQGEVPGQAA